MDEGEKDRLFIEIYTKLKEKLVGHQFRLPKPGSDYHQALIEARRMVDELGGDYFEFLQNEFKIYRYHSEGRKRRFYPVAKCLTFPSARERYIRLLKRRRFEGISYSVGGGWFTVKRTGRKYPIEQARAEVRLDSTASYVHKLAVDRMVPKVKRRLWEKCCYLVSKYEYKSEVMPPIIYNWIKEYVEGVIDG